MPSAQRTTVSSNIPSVEVRRRCTVRPYCSKSFGGGRRDHAEIDRLVGSATPHFAYQLRARILELIQSLPPDPDAPRRGEDGAARQARPCLVEG